MIYNKPPKLIGSFPLKVDEFFSYTYLPIKLADQSSPTVERRLQCFNSIIGRACCDFVGEFGLDRYVKSYVYLTAKHQHQRRGLGFNRPGWHSDGFLTDDISYIWYNSQPTVFNGGTFDLSADDLMSMEEMDEQANHLLNYSFPDNSLIRMDQFSIHRVGEFEEGKRAFAKICFSNDQYRLAGNSINYELDYSWEYIERRKERNVPQILQSSWRKLSVDGSEI